MSTTHRIDRRTLLMEQRLVSESVVVPIQHIRWIFGNRPRARGLKYHPIHGIDKLMDVWVA